MCRASYFCVAKVLGGFQQINMLKPTLLSLGGKKSLVQRIPQWNYAQT